MSTASEKQSRNLLFRFLDLVEWVGNKLPDPAVLFVIGIVVVGAISMYWSQVEFTELVPGSTTETIKIVNMLSLTEFAKLLSTMVNTFVTFAPLGVVLVALLGVGVAEHAGFINAVLKSLLEFTPKFLLTPMVIFVAVISHTATDAGYVLVIPLAGLMFYSAGRHPLAGIAAAFAGVSGGFSANFIPSGIDPLLSGLTEAGAKSVQAISVNPLCNWYFTSASSFLIIGVGWFLTDFLIEPKLKSTPVDGDPDQIPQMEAVTPREKSAMVMALATMVVGLFALFAWAWPENSSLRDPLGSLTALKNNVSDSGLTVELVDNQIRVVEAKAKGAAAAAQLKAGDVIKSIKGTSHADLKEFEAFIRKLPAGAPVLVEAIGADGASRVSILTPAAIPGAPLMNAIVPLIFLLFVIPGIVHGYASGRFKSHRDVIKGMSKTMESMAYYLVLVFFVSLFIYVFLASNIGMLLAVKGANSLKDKPVYQIIIGVILITALVNLLIGSASAKWAMLSPILVPMLMLLGISPEFTQAAYRVGDSTTNIITPMLPYFPLVVIFGQRYVKKTGIGTITSLMLPYSLTFLMLWTIFLLVFWMLNIPLGINGGYEYVKPGV